MNSVGPSSGLVQGSPQRSGPCPWLFSPLPHSLTLRPLVWNTRGKIHRIDSLNQASSKHPYPAYLLTFVFDLGDPLRLTWLIASWWNLSKSQAKDSIKEVIQDQGPVVRFTCSTRLEHLILIIDYQLFDLFLCTCNSLSSEHVQFEQHVIQGLLYAQSATSIDECVCGNSLSIPLHSLESYQIENRLSSSDQGTLPP